MDRERGTQKISLVFFRSTMVQEPVRLWLKDLPEAERHEIGRDLLRAQWRWPVGMPPLPCDGRWVVGDQDFAADWAYFARIAVRSRRMPGCAARIHQEDTSNAARRSGVGATAPKGVEGMRNKHVGSTIEDFLKDEGIFEEAQAEAVKEVVAWQLAEAMKAKNISKSKLAALLQTSRSQVDRLLDPKDDVTLSSLQRAAALVGRRVSVELV